LRGTSGYPQAAEPDASSGDEAILTSSGLNLQAGNALKRRWNALHTRRLPCWPKSLFSLEKSRLALATGRLTGEGRPILPTPRLFNTPTPGTAIANFSWGGPGGGRRVRHPRDPSPKKMPECARPSGLRPGPELDDGQVACMPRASHHRTGASPKGRAKNPLRPAMVRRASRAAPRRAQTRSVPTHGTSPLKSAPEIGQRDCYVIADGEAAPARFI
jgi:hypothetical protein